MKSRTDNMASFHPHVLQICILSLCVVLSTVHGKAPKISSTGVQSNGNEATILFDAEQEKMDDRPVEYDDEEFGDPADEKQYYYDPTYQQPFQAQTDSKHPQLMQPIDGTRNRLLIDNNVRMEDFNSESGHTLSENNEASPPVVNETKFGLKKLIKMEHTDAMHEMPDSVGQPRIATSVNDSGRSINKIVLVGSAPTTARSDKLNAAGSFQTVSDVIKRGVIRNATGNHTEEIFVDGFGTIKEPLKRGMPLLKEISMTKNDDRLGFGAVDNEPNETLPNSAISRNEIRIEQSKNPELESGSAAHQPQGSVTSGNDSKHNNIYGSETELDSNKQIDIVTLSTNNGTSTSVKYGGNFSEVNTKVITTLYSSSQLQPDGHGIQISGGESTNTSKGGDGTQHLEQEKNNTSSLAPQKEGNVSQQGTAYAPSSDTATSSKGTTKSQTSKPPSSQSSGDSLYDTSSTTTSTTTTQVGATYRKETSAKSDDSDLSIDQPPEPNRGGGSNIQQPYQGELVEEGLPMVPSTPVNDQDSHFFAYFASLLITAALGYVVYHNRNKILALLLEGRRARGSSGSRRGSSAGSIGRRRGRGGGGGGAKYLPLHTSLDQVMTSNGTENGGDSGLDRVY